MDWRKRLPAIAILLLIPSLFGGCAKPVTLYTEANMHVVNELVQPFTDKTGIPVDVIEFKHTENLVRGIAVYSDGKYVKTKHQTLFNYADVVFSTDYMTGEALKSMDMLLPYAPDAGKELADGVKRDGWWYGMGGRVCVLAWNTQRYRGEAPKGLLDLAAPAFPEGSVALISPNYLLYYYSGACAKLGRDTVIPFLQTMIDRKTQWGTDPVEVAAKVADGRAIVCLTTLEEADKQKKAGAPVAWAVPDQEQGALGAYLQFNSVCIPKVSTMPEAGRQLADYLLSPEAEALSVKLGLSNATLRQCGMEAPVVRPLDTDLAAAQDAMQNGLNSILSYFSQANPQQTGK